MDRNVLKERNAIPFLSHEATFIDSDTGYINRPYPLHYNASTKYLMTDEKFSETIAGQPIDFSSHVIKQAYYNKNLLLSDRACQKFPQAKKHIHLEIKGLFYHNSTYYSKNMLALSKDVLTHHGQKVRAYPLLSKDFYCYSSKEFEDKKNLDFKKRSRLDSYEEFEIQMKMLFLNALTEKGKKNKKQKILCYLDGVPLNETANYPSKELVSVALKNSRFFTINIPQRNERTVFDKQRNYYTCQDIVLNAVVINANVPDNLKDDFWQRVGQIPPQIVCQSKQNPNQFQLIYPINNVHQKTFLINENRVLFDETYYMLNYFFNFGKPTSFEKSYKGELRHICANFLRTDLWNVTYFRKPTPYVERLKYVETYLNYIQHSNAHGEAIDLLKARSPKLERNETKWSIKKTQNKVSFLEDSLPFAFYKFKQENNIKGVFYQNVFPQVDHLVYDLVDLCALTTYQMQNNHLVENYIKQRNAFEHQYISPLLQPDQYMFNRLLVIGGWKKYEKNIKNKFDIRLSYDDYIKDANSWENADTQFFWYLSRYAFNLVELLYLNQKDIHNGLKNSRSGSTQSKLKKLLIKHLTDFVENNPKAKDFKNHHFECWFYSNSFVAQTQFNRKSERYLSYISDDVMKDMKNRMDTHHSKKMIPAIIKKTAAYVSRYYSCKKNNYGCAFGKFNEEQSNDKSKRIQKMLKSFPEILEMIRKKQEITIDFKITIAKKLKIGKDAVLKYLNQLRKIEDIQYLSETHLSRIVASTDTIKRYLLRTQLETFKYRFSHLNNEQTILNSFLTQRKTNLTNKYYDKEEKIKSIPIVECHFRNFFKFNKKIELNEYYNHINLITKNSYLDRTESKHLINNVKGYFFKANQIFNIHKADHSNAKSYDPIKKIFVSNYDCAVFLAQVKLQAALQLMQDIAKKYTEIKKTPYYIYYMDNLQDKLIK